MISLLAKTDGVRLLILPKGCANLSEAAKTAKRCAEDAQPIRLGIIGLGNMGRGHSDNFLSGHIKEMRITAVADINPDKLSYATEKLPWAKQYATASELMDSGEVDAVIVCTPHYFHPPLVIEALSKGLHVISEKPAGVYTKQVREMNEAAAKSDKVFAMMFNQRTNHVYRKVKEIVDSKKYGEIRRVNWIITEWYRPQFYYNSGGWRATWAGEGGGVLLNQCPHQLDLWQWICGMPCKIRAFLHEGKWHDIEVEDDATIYAEYPNGATGVFVTSTGDYPGSNRLEITLDGARILCEHDQIRLTELDEPLSSFTVTCKSVFGKVGYHDVPVETDGKNEQHVGVMNAFSAHILYGEPLIAAGTEGINGLTISNAAHLSSWTNQTVTLPLDEDLFYEELKKRIATSRAKGQVQEVVQDDMSSTY
ncbi:MAG: Gfo/Idh/MocA family oxidoreductase [Clostridia bacterium]|nr:Gfo/Idh/MocA family oxidoreductase [Clostridia bacterium]MBQ4290062.1 Gfo/Idh/MocA family oxidoreductase [Clostridia bacterium]